MRGAASGALWTLGEADAIRSGSALTAVRRSRPPRRLPHRPVRPGARGRPAADRTCTSHRQLFIGYADEEFLTALPSLRLAFTYFTPREKHHMALTLLESLRKRTRGTIAGGTRGSPEAPRGADVREPLFQAVERYGLRGASDETSERLVRWRLVLGERPTGLGCPLEGRDAEQDRALGYLYDREYGPAATSAEATERTRRTWRSQLTVPDWINAVHTLFPKKTIERIEKDALERYQLQEMVTNPDFLPRPAEPDAAQGRAAHQAPDEPASAGDGPRWCARSSSN